MENCRLVNANLENADLTGGVFVHCDFSNANLRGAKLERARFVNPNFTGAVMPDGSTFSGDLRAFNAVVVTRRIKIDIGLDDDDEKSKPDDMI